MVKAERWLLIFSGPVQGVGFRMTAVRFAEDFTLTGTVRNLSNGDVELMVEGVPADMEALMNRLCEHFGAGVRMVHQTPSSSGPAAAGVRIVF